MIPLQTAVTVYVVCFVTVKAAVYGRGGGMWNIPRGMNGGTADNNLLNLFPSGDTSVMQKTVGMDGGTSVYSLLNGNLSGDRGGMQRTGGMDGMQLLPGIGLQVLGEAKQPDGAMGGLNMMQGATNGFGGYRRKRRADYNYIHGYGF